VSEPTIWQNCNIGDFVFLPSVTMSAYSVRGNNGISFASKTVKVLLENHVTPKDLEDAATANRNEPIDTDVHSDKLVMPSPAKRRRNN
jgi:hypothetical protein